MQPFICNSLHQERSLRISVSSLAAHCSLLGSFEKVCPLRHTTDLQHVAWVSVKPQGSSRGCGEVQGRSSSCTQLLLIVQSQLSPPCNGPPGSSPPQLPVTSDVTSPCLSPHLSHLVTILVLYARVCLLLSPAGHSGHASFVTLDHALNFSVLLFPV